MAGIVNGALHVKALARVSSAHLPNLGPSGLVDLSE